MAYTLDDVKEIGAILKAVYTTGHLTQIHLNFARIVAGGGDLADGDEADGLLKRMKKYPEVWPEDGVAQLEEVSGEIRMTESSLHATRRTAESPPCLHHAGYGEVEEHEKAPEKAAKLEAKLVELKEKRKQILIKGLGL